MPTHLPRFSPLPFRPCRQTVVVASAEVCGRAMELGGLLPRLCEIASVEPLPRWEVTAPFGLEPHALLRLIRIESGETMHASGEVRVAAASPRRCRHGWERLARVLGRRHGLADAVLAWLRDRSPADATAEDRRVV